MYAAVKLHQRPSTEVEICGAAQIASLELCISEAPGLRFAEELLIHVDADHTSSPSRQFGRPVADPASQMENGLSSEGRQRVEDARPGPPTILPSVIARQTHEVDITEEPSPVYKRC